MEMVICVIVNVSDIDGFEVLDRLEFLVIDVDGNFVDLFVYGIVLVFDFVIDGVMVLQDFVLSLLLN